jgi:hypothetical protein
VAQLVEVPGPIPGRVLGHFLVTSSFCSHSVALRSTQHLTEISTKDFPWDKVRPARTADGSAVLVVQNVKVRMEARHSTSHQSLHYLLRESITFTVMWMD